MSLLAATAESFNIDENNTDNKNIRNDNKSRLSSSLNNKTLKNRGNDEKKKQIQKMMKSMDSSNDESPYLSNNESSDMSDFNPPPHPELFSPNNQESDNIPVTQVDKPVSKENFTQLPSTYAADYYSQYAKYQNENNLPTQQNISSLSNQELLNKLDNILYILEQQQDNKTNYVTEELILYIFLGVFVIYVIDSFVKVGKYIR
jgi:hypothetical protein